jgi:hypothetical protein
LSVDVGFWFELERADGEKTERETHAHTDREEIGKGAERGDGTFVLIHYDYVETR